MTTPYERTRALVQTRDFLQRLATLGDDAVPISLLMEAETLLRHYPVVAQIELAHKALPMFFGPVLPKLNEAALHGVMPVPRLGGPHA
nr:BPSL0761 family protein [uncultured Albidiferax sp.]